MCIRGASDCSEEGCATECMRARKYQASLPSEWIVWCESHVHVCL